MLILYVHSVLASESRIVGKKTAESLNASNLVPALGALNSEEPLVS